MEESHGNGSVRYTVKELLDAIDKKLDKALAKLEHKVDTTDHLELVRRVGALEDEAKISRVLATTRETNREKGMTKWQTWAIVFSSFASGAALVLTAFPHKYL